MYLHRTIYFDKFKTSIALERIFWQSIDDLSEGNWQKWVKEILKKKPDNLGRTTYLRTIVHKAALSGKINRKVED